MRLGCQSLLELALRVLIASAFGAFAANAAAADYVVGKVCGDCHAKAYEAWRGSHHDLAMQAADAKSVLGNFANAKFTYAGITSTFFRRGDGYFVNTDGLLIGDRPVLFKVQGLVELPWGVTAAANFQHQTGRPWGRRERVNGLGVPVTIRVETIDGSRRVPDWNFLDIRLQKDFRIAAARVGGFVDILNATNSDAHQNIGSDLGSSEAFGTPTFFVNPRTVMLGAKVRF